MIIENGTTPTIVFLLISEQDPTMPAPDKDPDVFLAKNGGSFSRASGTVRQMGSGWYSVQLSEAETDVDGPLVVRAEASETLEWRDIHQVTSSFAAHLVDVVYDRIADHILRRNYASAAQSAFGDTKDFRSLLGAVAKDVNKVQLVDTTLEIYEDDDQTVLGRQTVVSNANAAPITGIDTE